MADISKLVSHWWFWMFLGFTLGAIVLALNKRQIGFLMPPGSNFTLYMTRKQKFFYTLSEILVFIGVILIFV